MKLNRIKAVLAEKASLRHGWLSNLIRVSVWSMLMLAIGFSLIWKPYNR